MGRVLLKTCNFKQQFWSIFISISEERMVTATRRTGNVIYYDQYYLFFNLKSQRLDFFCHMSCIYTLNGVNEV